jgi:heme-degrading monooxygenase HmoA
MHARVVMYTFKPRTIDAVIKKAEAGLLPVFRKHAGFRSYQVIKTGPDTAISLSTWDSEAEAKAAVKLGAAWVKANIATDVVSAETHVGTVSFSHRPSRPR